MESNLWNNFKSILGQYRWQFSKALALVIIANLLLILVPLVFRHALLMVNTSEEVKGPLAAVLYWLLGSKIQSLWSWATILLLISFVGVYFKYNMRIGFLTISRAVERDLRSKLFGRIQEQSMAFYDKHGIGELLSRLTNDISSYRDMLGPGLMYPAFVVTLVIPGLGALFSISTPLAAVSIIPLLAIPILNLSMRQGVYLLSHQAQKGLADLSTMTQEHYSGIRILKAYVAEPQMSERFSRLCGQLMRINIKLNCLQGLLNPFFNLLIKMVTVVLVIFTGLIILKAWGTLSTADFLSFMWIQGYVFFPVLMLAWVLPIYQRGNAAYERLLEVFNEPIEVINDPRASLNIPLAADIEFRDLTFCYPNAHKNILQNFSLRIKGGSFVGVTGPVGAGKTTLFRLLNREYEIPKGKLYVGGHDVHEYPLEAFWKELVTVEQTPFLFSRSILENVRFGNEEALQAEIEAAAGHADLHETILNFPEQYNTTVGERGVTLSGGQKQRVAMARAFLVDRSILLLDDVFSALDTETQMRIFMAMQSKLKNKTLLLITHRVSVLEAMDRVIYMKDGRIVEDGTPKELKAKKGPYATLAALQHVKEKF